MIFLFQLRIFIYVCTYYWDVNRITQCSLDQIIWKSFCYMAFSDSAQWKRRYCYEIKERNFHTAVVTIVGCFDLTYCRRVLPDLQWHFFDTSTSIKYCAAITHFPKPKLETLARIQNGIATALIGSWAPLDMFQRKSWQKQDAFPAAGRKQHWKKQRETLCQATGHRFLLTAKNIRGKPLSDRGVDIPLSKRNPRGEEAEMPSICFNPATVT